MKRTPFQAIAPRSIALFALAFFVAMLGLASTAAAQGRELSLADILIALRSKKAIADEKNKILTDAVKQRGITFALTPEIEKELGTTGARPELIAAIREKKAPAKTEPTTEVSATLAEPKSVKLEPAAKPVPPPPDFTFYRNRATQELKANDLDAATADLDKAAEFKPAEASIFADRGVILLRKEKNEDALVQFSKAIELNPSDAVSFFNRGMVKERLGKADDALADFEKAAALDPTDEPAKTAVSRLKKSKADAEALAAAAKAAAAPKVESAKTPSVVNAGALNPYVARLAMPVYPSLEKRLGIQGTVTVLVNLDAAGTVISAKAVDGLKSFYPAAEYAVKNSKFKPVIRDGQPVAAYGTMSFRFTP